MCKGKPDRTGISGHRDRVDERARSLPYPSSIYPPTNVVYLTAYVRYAFDAWSTGASGFMRKPLTPEGIRDQLSHLRYPFWTGDSSL